jgi:hypothetical protein
MTVLAIDPGCEQSAWVLYDDGGVKAHKIAPNDAVVSMLRDSIYTFAADMVVIEQVASYGMAVGREVFETVWWAGRFAEARGERATRMFRRDVKLHFCQSARAKDANVRQALLDRFGGEKAAKGTKAAPGPLHGLRKDEWQALALAVTWWDLNCRNNGSQAILSHAL